MTRKILLIGLVPLAALGVAFAVSGASHKTGGSPDTQVVALGGSGGLVTAQDEVRAAVTNALRKHQTLPVTPVQQPGKLPMAADFDRQVANGTAAVHAIFADAPAKKEIDGLNKAVAMQRSGHFRVLDGGIDNLNFKSVDLDSTAAKATVHATVDTWSHVSMKNPDGAWHDAQPRNTLVVTMTLSKNSTGWIVQTFEWTFAPGSEP